MKIFYDGRIYGGQAGGGINRYFTNLISRLPTTVEPTLTAIYHPAAQFPSHPNLKVYKYKRFRLTRLSAALEQTYFCALEPRLTFDLAHPTYYSLLTQREMSKYSVPPVVTVYDMIHERYPHMFRSNDKTIEAKRQAILSAQAILCISDSTKRDLLEYYNIPESKITVTHLATDFELSWAYGAEPVPEQPYFLYVGKRDRYKNFKSLLKAFAKAFSTQPDIRLCVTGSPFDAAEKQEISDLGLSNSIHHYGHATDSHLAKLYRCSVAFVYPSLYEGFGIPPLEAMACSAPVIASDCSSIPEVVGDAGVLVDPTSVHELTDALLFMLEHPAERDRLISKGTERLKQFSWDMMTAKTYEIYTAISN